MNSVILKASLVFNLLLLVSAAHKDKKDSKEQQKDQQYNPLGALVRLVRKFYMFWRMKLIILLFKDATCFHWSSSIVICL
jgi:hypothetical protein